MKWLKMRSCLNMRLFFFFNIYSFCILLYPYYKDLNLNFLLSLSTLYHFSQISKSIWIDLKYKEVVSSE